MKILIHHANPPDATSFYRAYGPFLALARQYPEIQVDHVEMFPALSWHNLSKYDIIFLQRPASQWEVSVMRICQQVGIPVWCDWDDNYFEIPESNNRKKFYTPEIVECVKWLAENADYITVSTEKLFDKFHALNRHTTKIQNMLDPKFFSMKDSEPYSRDNLILWRGSDTHNENFEYFKDELLELMDETQDWVWGFFGYVPQWAIDKLPSHRIRIYQEQGTVEFIRMLLALRPKMVYVLHSPNEFNESRSNIAFIESTYAGAVCVTPNTAEWAVPSFRYTGKEDFKDRFMQALEATDDHKYVVARAKEWVLQNAMLDSENGVLRSNHNNLSRKFIAEYIINNYEKKHLPPVNMPEQFTDKEFFEYHIRQGWSSESEGWRNGQELFAKFLIGNLEAKSVFDLGCGSGGLLETLIKHGITCYGVDSNENNKAFFDKRNPGHEDAFILGDAAQVQFGNKFDVVTCVEVMEHIPDEVNKQLLALWRDQCKYFVFTSTPYTSTPTFDIQWGHINVKPTDHWIKFFEENGYMLVDKLEVPAPWALLFMPYPKK